MHKTKKSCLQGSREIQSRFITLILNPSQNGICNIFVTENIEKIKEQREHFSLQKHLYTIVVYCHNVSRSRCDKDGGSLVQIENDQDEIVIHDFAKNTGSPIWIGLRSMKIVSMQDAICG